MLIIFLFTVSINAEATDCGIKQWTDEKGDMHWSGEICGDINEQEQQQLKLKKPIGKKSEEAQSNGGKNKESYKKEIEQRNRESTIQIFRAAYDYGLYGNNCHNIYLSTINGHSKNQDIKERAGKLCEEICKMGTIDKKSGENNFDELLEGEPMQKFLDKTSQYGFNTKGFLSIFKKYFKSEGMK